MATLEKNTTEMAFFETHAKSLVTYLEKFTPSQTIPIPHIHIHARSDELTMFHYFLSHFKTFHKLDKYLRDHQMGINMSIDSTDKSTHTINTKHIYPQCIVSVIFNQEIQEQHINKHRLMSPEQSRAEARTECHETSETLSKILNSLIADMRTQSPT